MSKAEELLAHAARCHRLAEACTDQTVAEELRRLADDYLQLSALRSEQASPAHLANAGLVHGDGRPGAPVKPADRATSP